MRLFAGLGILRNRRFSLIFLSASMFLAFLFAGSAKAQYDTASCPAPKTPSLGDLVVSTKETLVVDEAEARKNCPGINPSLECCYSTQTSSASMVGTVSYVIKPKGKSLPLLLCCPAGFFEILSSNSGAGVCSPADLSSLPKGSWTEKTHCCKKLNVSGNLPPDTTLPLYRLRETIQVTEKITCEPVAIDPATEICKSISNPQMKEECAVCARSQGVYTAVGCIQRIGSKLITNIATVLFGILGGVILITILYAAFKISTSRGDPKAVAEGKETITSVISGTLIVLFSATLLQFVGVSVFSIPGFPPPVAQDVGKSLAQTLGLREELTTIGGTVGTFLNYAIVIGGLILFVMILWGGFGILAAAGDPQGQESAKKRISAAAIGFAVLFISFWVMQILQIATGATIFR